jgi:hypothetical protein
MAHPTAATSSARPRRKPLYMDMSVQVFVGMVIGAAIGWLWPGTAEWMRTLGELFIRLIGMLVGLIIFCAIVHGIATVGEAKKVGRVAIKALIYFEVVTTFALIIGLSMINLLGPGRGMNVDPHLLSGAGLDQYVHTAQQISGTGFLLHLVPHTIVSAFTEGNVLQVVFVSVLFAFGLLAMGDRGKPVVDLLGATQQIVFKIVGYIMWLAPIGAMGAIGFTVARFGVSSLVSLGALVGEARSVHNPHPPARSRSAHRLRSHDQSPPEPSPASFAQFGVRPEHPRAPAAANHSSSSREGKGARLPSPALRLAQASAIPASGSWRSCPGLKRIAEPRRPSAGPSSASRCRQSPTRHRCHRRACPRE